MSRQMVARAGLLIAMLLGGFVPAEASGHGSPVVFSAVEAYDGATTTLTTSPEHGGGSGSTVVPPRGLPGSVLVESESPVGSPGSVSTTASQLGRAADRLDTAARATARKAARRTVRVSRSVLYCIYRL